MSSPQAFVLCLLCFYLGKIISSFRLLHWFPHWIFLQHTYEGLNNKILHLLSRLSGFYPLFIKHSPTRAHNSSRVAESYLKKSGPASAVVRCLYLLWSLALLKNINPSSPVTGVYLCKCRGGQIVSGLACTCPFVSSPRGPPFRDSPCVQVETLPSTLLAG